MNVLSICMHINMNIYNMYVYVCFRNISYNTICSLHNAQFSLTWRRTEESNVKEGDEEDVVIIEKGVQIVISKRDIRSFRPSGD